MLAKLPPNFNYDNAAPVLTALRTVTLQDIVQCGCCMRFLSEVSLTTKSQRNAAAHMLNLHFKLYRI